MSIKFIAVDIGNTIITPLSGSWYITRLLRDILDEYKVLELHPEFRIHECIEDTRRKYQDVILLSDDKEEYNFYCMFYDSIFNTKRPLLKNDIIERVAYDRAFGDGHYEVVTDLVRLLQGVSDTCTMGLFSNTYPSVIRFLEKEGIAKLFDINCLSYKEGIKKPNESMFELLRQKAGMNPSDILIIDDNLNCIDTANRLGFMTMHMDLNDRSECLRRLGGLL